MLPAMPWSLGRRTNADSSFILATTGLALVCQLLASVALAKGTAVRHNYSAAGFIGFAIIFLLASLAIGTCIWLAGCASGFSLKS